MRNDRVDLNGRNDMAPGGALLPSVARSAGLNGTITDTNDFTDTAARGAGPLGADGQIVGMIDSATTLSDLTLPGGRAGGQERDGGAIRSEAPPSLTDHSARDESTEGNQSSEGGVYGGALILTNGTASGGSLAGTFVKGGGIVPITLQATPNDLGNDGPTLAMDARGGADSAVFVVAESELKVSSLGSVEALAETPSLVVTTLGDVVDDMDNLTSLREAVAFANSQAGTDTVTFDAGLNGTLRLTQGEIAITEAVTIDGDGRITVTGDANDDDVTVDGDITDVAATGATLLLDNSRIFDITGVYSATTIDSLTLTGGRTNGTFDDGGAIRSDAALTLIDSALIGNSTAAAASDGGAIFGDSSVTLTNTMVSGNSTAGSASQGGGIYAYGAITLTSSTVSGNSTQGFNAIGGGIAGLGTVTLTNSTIAGNTTSGDDASGGGVWGYYAISLTNSTVTGNATTGGNAYGGGIYSFTGLTLTNSIVLGNVTSYAGVGGDELYQYGGALVTYTGGNIVGTDVFNGSTDIGDTTAADVFSATFNKNGVNGGVVADNGGPVETVALLGDVSNPAIDAGNDGAAPATDARGETRTDAPGVANNGANISDLGAFEVQVEAQSLIVTTLHDVVNQLDGVTSLREAVAFAEAQAGADTITFDGSLNGVLRLTQGEIGITDELTIDGDGRITITGDADDDDVTVMGDITDVAASGAALLDDNSRIFNVTDAGAATTLIGLTLTGGRTTGMSQNGGAIRSLADLTLTDSTVSGNSTAAASSQGGGIWGSGTITLTNSTVSGNSTAGSNATGGGISGSGAITLTNSTVSGNSTAGNYAFGGGIWGGEAITLTNSTISGNSTAGNNATGGGIYGAGVGATDLTLTNSIVLGNVTTYAGVGGDELLHNAGNGGSIVYTGGNIVGTDIFSGAADVGDVTAADVFAATVNNGGTDAGVLADNGGQVQTIALLPGGFAVNAGVNGAALAVPLDETVIGHDLNGDGDALDLIDTVDDFLFDARGSGFDRIGTVVDLGAFEVQFNVIPGGGGVDSLTGAATDDLILLMGGNDFGDGGAGSDRIEGGAGEDSIVGGAGRDFLLGGSEGDVFDVVDGGERDIVVGGDGLDIVSFATLASTLVFDFSDPSRNTGEGAVDLLIGVEGVQGPAGHAAELVGDDGQNILIGGGLADTLLGNGADDTIIGGAGADTVTGGDGDDTADYSDSPAAVTIFLGTSASGGDAEGDVLTGIENLTGSAFGDFFLGDGNANTLSGGAGVDFLQGGVGADVLDGGADFDWASYSDAPGPLTIDLATPANSSAFFAEDTLVDIQGIVGASGFSNTITGSALADVLDGGGQADTIDGGAGFDIIFGEGGNDVLRGGTGGDAILGNSGNDELWGGTDTAVDGFYFNDNNGDDVIKDFDLANDVFVFISAVFNAITDLSFGTDINGHGVITYGGASITVEGVTEAELQAEGLYFWF